MIKTDLKMGNVVLLQNGVLCLVCQEGRLTRLDDGSWECNLDDYMSDLTTLDDDEHDYDIVTVYEDYHLDRVLYERKDDSKVAKLRMIRCMLDELIEEQNN